MVKVRKNADDRQGEVEVMGDDSEVMINGGTTVGQKIHTLFDGFREYYSGVTSLQTFLQHLLFLLP